MGFLTDLIIEKRSFSSGMKAPTEIFQRFFGGVDTKAGVQVNDRTALSLTAVWSCILMKARIMASFPLPVYERLVPKGKERATTHPLYEILHDTPNKEQTSFEWRLQMSISYDLWGAGISEIEFDTRGRPVALWPIPAWRVSPKRSVLNDSLYYDVCLPDGKNKKLYPYQMIVIRHFPWERDCWLSPIAVHRETIGSALAVKEFGARTFGQGVNPAGILKGVDLGEETTEQDLRKKYGSYEGLGQSHRLMLLEEGVEFQRVGLPPEDAQYLETNKFGISEIARIYNMPLFLLQDHEKSTSWGSGLEELKNGLIAFNFRPGCVQWEQEINKKLFDDRRFFSEFLMDGLLRGNVKDRFEAYRIARDLGMYSINDLLELENRNPLPGELGNVRLVPMNMQTLEAAIAGDQGDTNTGGQNNAED